MYVVLDNRIICSQIISFMVIFIFVKMFAMSARHGSGARLTAVVSSCASVGGVKPLFK